MIVNRYDKIDLSDKDATRFEKTPEGYLRGRAVIARTGVYQYVKTDGSADFEYRDYSEVFNPASLESLKLKPVVLLHPSTMVKADNVKVFQVGNLGSEPIAVPRGAEHDLVIDLIIQDAEAVAKVESGEMRELSMGYQCDIEDAPLGAKFDSKEYNKIQKNITHNHCAVVPVGRAGNAVIKMDAEDAYLVTQTVLETVKEDKLEEARMADLKKIKLDGVEYEAESKVLETLHAVTEKSDALQGSLDALTADKTKVEAERDTLKDKADALEKEVAELKNAKLDEAVIKAAVERRVKILDSARLAEVEVKEDMDEVAIQKAIIVKIFPNAKLDGKDAVYIDARFDGAIETLEAKNDAQNRQAVVPDVNTETKNDEKDVVDANKARERMLANLKKKE